MKYLIAFVVFGLACSALANTIARVEEKIWENLESAETTNVLVTFRKANTKAATDRFNALKITSRDARLNTYHSIHKDHADLVQADVKSMLDKAASSGKTHQLEQLWISNELIVRNVDKEIVEKLRSHPDVESVQAEWFIQLEDVIEEETIMDNTIQNQWGVENTRAHLAWNYGYEGNNITIGAIDTGARVTHATLRYTYRGNYGTPLGHNYNWYAPTGQAAVPSDTNGHGTHVIGSAAGTDGVGVARRAWHINCRGCATASCSNFDLLGCGNWMTCPTTTSNTAPNCAYAPRVVNNSWGGGRNNAWYDDIMNAWIAVGIVPIFSAGNSGAACANTISPADRPPAISIGSSAANNQRSTFSSNGPIDDGRISPFITAPGTSIPSSSHLDDVNLRTLSGTSMAAPHISGVVALILGQNPNYTVQQVRNALQRGGVPHVSAGQAICGGTPETAFPNNRVGHGLISALLALGLPHQ